ncbi:MAG: hypothetical protein U1E33_05350 [Rhodospirillales bacterium]
MPTVFQDYRPLPYDGPQSIRAILDGLTRFGAGARSPRTAASSRSPTTAAARSRRWSSGQVELSRAPLENIHQTCCEIGGHLSRSRPSAPR